MAAILIVIGIVLMIFWSVFWGLILVLIGVALLFVPALPGGYAYWRGRRGPPP